MIDANILLSFTYDQLYCDFDRPHYTAIIHIRPTLLGFRSKSLYRYHSHTIYFIGISVDVTIPLSFTYDLLYWDLGRRHYTAIIHIRTTLLGFRSTSLYCYRSHTIYFIVISIDVIVLLSFTYDLLYWDFGRRHYTAIVHIRTTLLAFRSTSHYCYHSHTITVIVIRSTALHNYRLHTITFIVIRSTALQNYRLHTITFIVIRSTALQNYRLHTIKKKRITVIAVHTLTNYQMNGTSVLIITYNLLD